MKRSLKFFLSTIFVFLVSSCDSGEASPTSNVRSESSQISVTSQENFEMHYNDSCHWTGNGQIYPHELTHTVITEPTCMATGQEKVSCYCGYSKINTLPTVAHDYSITDVYSQPTCTENQKDIHRCRWCGDTWIEEIPNSTSNHTFTDWISNNDATCSSDGTKYHFCTKCGFSETVTDEFSKKTHEWWPTESFEPTCTEDGWTHYICLLCFEEKTIVNEGSAKGHSWSISSQKLSTCEEDGWTNYVCDECGEEKSTVEGAIGHNFVDGTCKNCGDFKYKDQIVLNEPLPQEHSTYSSKIKRNKFLVTQVSFSTREESPDKVLLYHIIVRMQKTWENTTYPNGSNEIGLRIKVMDLTTNESLLDDTWAVHANIDDVGAYATYDYQIALHRIIDFNLNHKFEVSFLNQHGYSN